VRTLLLATRERGDYALAKRSEVDLGKRAGDERVGATAVAGAMRTTSATVNGKATVVCCDSMARWSPACAPNSSSAAATQRGPSPPGGAISPAARAARWIFRRHWADHAIVSPGAIRERHLVEQRLGTDAHRHEARCERGRHRFRDRTLTQQDREEERRADRSR